jgi:hypothetical protein
MCAKMEEYIMQINEVYVRAAEKLGYPGSAACMNYLKVLFTPEEGELLMEFLKPATCQQVAERLKGPSGQAG